MSLIIGYGNTLRTDDAIGQFIAEALGGIAIEQLSLDYAETISQVDFLVLLDAAYGETAGEIKIEAIHAQDGIAMTHQSSPNKLLQMTKELYGSAPETLLITITGANFDYGDKFSPELQVLLPRLVEQVKDIIRNHDKA